VVDDPEVEVLAAQVGVAVRGEHLVRLSFVPEDRHVERAAAEIEHEEGLRFGFLVRVRERSGRRLVDQPIAFDARELRRVERREALRVREVRRDRDDRLRDLTAEDALGVLPHRP
jgi:hypothetical protein